MKKKFGYSNIRLHICTLLLITQFVALGQNINKPNKSGPLGIEVNTLSGNLLVPRYDMLLPSRGLPIKISFYYNSYSYKEDYGFGNGWSFYYHIKYRTDSAGNKTITWGDGREDKYEANGNGTFKSPKGFFTALSEYQPSKLSLTEKNGTKFLFDNNIHKKITRMEDANGNSISFQYSDTLLMALTNSAGQSISFAYEKGRLSAVTDAITAPTRTYTYSYDDAGNLVAAKDPLNGSLQYTYLVNGPMKTVKDKNANLVNIIYYNDFSISEVIGCNKRISFSYDTASLTSYATDHLTTGTNQVTRYEYKKQEDQYWLAKVSGNCCGFDAAFDFDAEGNKIKETDANGNVYTYTYDGKGNMLTITNPLNQVLSYTYTADFNKVATMKDFNGNAYTLSYDNKGNLTQVAEPGGIAYTASYNLSGDITHSTDPKGNVYTYTYDAFGNPASVTGPNGYQATLAFNGRGNLLSYSDAAGNSHAAEFDILNRLKKIIDPLNNTIEYNYDAEGNVTSLRNKNAEQNLFYYDASNRLVKFTDPMGGQTQFAYDGMDNLTGWQNSLGNSWQAGYDKRNRLAGLKQPLNENYTYNTDNNGNVKTITLPNGQVVNYTYDKLNRLLNIKDATGEIGAVTYDANGNITSLTAAGESTTTAEYDNQDRLVKITDALGYSSTFMYDPNNNVIGCTDRNGFTRSYTYDGRNRVKTFTNSNGGVVAVNYDALGNVTSLKDENDQTTSYTYNALNQVKRITYSDNSFIELGYDVKGNITSKRLTDGTTITYQYDALSRLVKRILPGGESFTYTYDALGRMITASNSAGVVTLGYDALNRITSESFDGRTTRYGYNTAGRTQTTIYPDSTVIVKSFDSRNRLSSITKNGTLLVSYLYNNRNWQIARTYGNGISTQLQFDYAARLSSILTANGTIQNSTFTYDKERNRTSVARLNTTTASEQYIYDSTYRLKAYKRGTAGGTASTEKNYMYDAVGNRIALTVNGVSTTYSHNNLNQLTASAGGASATYLYDNNGNRSFESGYHKTYDAEGRLMKDSASPSNIILYAYDAFGRRIMKTINGISLKYSYSGLAQIEERSGIDDQLVKRTVYKNLITPVLLEKNSEKYYYHQNELNSVEAITNNSGSLIESYQYDAYGKPTVFNAANAIISQPLSGNNIGFTGQEYDYNTENYRFHFRNYSPATGSFLQRDPVGYADGTSMYQYAHNNPANGIDILGLKCGDPPPSLLPQNGGDWTLYIGNNVISNINAITSVRFPNALLSHPVLGIVLTPISAIGTANTISSLQENWSTNTYGQNVDGVISAGSGVLSTGLGVASTSIVAGGTAAEMMFGGASFTAAFGEGLGAAGTAFGVGSGLTAGGALVASAGGLAIYGVTNEGVRLLTGRTLAENGEQIPNPPVEWLYSGKGYDYQNIGSRYWERSESGMSWRVSRKWTDIRDLIEQGRYQELRQKYHPEPNCPCNGTQRPNPGGPGTTKSTEVISALDPNEIIGPDGYGNEKFVSVKDRLPYTITYENDKSATAPAKYVKITTPIQPKMDASTFRLGSFGFNNLTFAIPDGTSSYYQRLDARDSLGLYVDVTAGYDQLNNKAFWEFQSIDPTTLLPPTDPLKGFLLLQDTVDQTKGHGFVNFSIKPIASAVTGDTISTDAAIIFDQNPVIPTNLHKNTIDAVAPTGSITGLPASTPDTEITLVFAGTDDAGGSGISSFSVYISDNDGPLQLYVSNFAGTDTTFRGLEKHTYKFYVLATDNVGNTEALKLAGSVRITDGEEVICPNGNVTFESNIGGSSYQWQVDIGTGFTNIVNGSVYSGGTTAALTLTAAPTSFYGYQYRCLVDGNNFSDTMVVKFAMTWTGNVSTAWENAANWSCGSLPDANTDVMINGGRERYPLVSANAFVRTLRTNAGSTVTVKSNYTLTVAK